MPELPEVETVLGGLKTVLAGKKILTASVRSPKLRTIISPSLAKHIEQGTVIGFRRRAKYIILDLDNEKSLLVHLGMSGSFAHWPHGKADRDLDRHDHLLLALEGGSALIFRDPRRFGILECMDTKEIDDCIHFRKLGPEPLGKNFSAGYLRAKIGQRKIPIKQAIMDQSIVVGVGNIYASEALYHARINPLRPSCEMNEKELKSLVAAIKLKLRAAIKAGGSTLRDYRQVGGEAGCFQTSFNVYDREGLTCPDCSCNARKTGGIQRVIQGGRSTFYCPDRQK